MPKELTRQVTLLLLTAALVVHSETAPSASPAGDSTNGKKSFSKLTVSASKNSTLSVPTNQTGVKNTPGYTNRVEPLKKSSKKIPNSKTISKPNKTTPTKAGLVAPESVSRRRIREEWKDAVKAGICYDWMKESRVVSSRTVSDNPDAKLICLGPLGTNLRHWHFSFRGVKNSMYGDGIFHGRIILPKDYPSSPPRVQMLTPSGRFRTSTDICLSASNYHPETWTPRWTVLSLVHALRLHMLTNPQEAGGIVRSSQDIREYAEKSQAWTYKWKSGRSWVTIDHAKMLKQGVLCLDSEEEGEDVQMPPRKEIQLNATGEVILTRQHELCQSESENLERSVSLEYASEAVATLEQAKSKQTKKRNRPKSLSVRDRRRIGSQEPTRLLRRGLIGLVICSSLSQSVRGIYFNRLLSNPVKATLVLILVTFMIGWRE